MLWTKRKTVMPEPEQALPGRENEECSAGRPCEITVGSALRYRDMLRRPAQRRHHVDAAVAPDEREPATVRRPGGLARRVRILQPKRTATIH